MHHSRVQPLQHSRLYLGVAIWLGCAIAVVLPLVWLINNRDWGVALMLIMPVVVYGLMRLGRRLERWARAPARQARVT